MKHVPQGTLSDTEMKRDPKDTTSSSQSIPRLPCMSPANPSRRRYHPDSLHPIPARHWSQLVPEWGRDYRKMPARPEDVRAMMEDGISQAIDFMRRAGSTENALTIAALNYKFCSIVPPAGWI